MLDELVRVCKNLTEHIYESQQNTSLLLDLHQRRETPGAVALATATTTRIPSDASDAKEKSAENIVHEAEYMSASFDASTSSSCEEISAISCASPVEQSLTFSIDEQPKLQRHSQQGPYRRSDESFNSKGASTILQKVEDLEQNDVDSSNLSVTPTRSVSSQLASPKLAAERAHRPHLYTSQCIYPDLIGCTETIASLYRHFPMGFRPFFSFYKIKTVGDLSTLPVEKVKTFGLKEPVSTVRRALEEFNGRKDRMKLLSGSPFHQRSGSTTTSPAIPTPSPHKRTKRPFHVDSGVISPLILKTREHKRTKRSLVLDAEDGEEEQESETRQKPKLADKVTLCLQSCDSGETRITRPGEESQDQIELSEKIDENENVQEKMDTYTLKLLQHLRRSAYYMDKLVAEEESLQSEEASLQTNIATVGGVITNYHEAHDLVARLASQLQIAAETSSKRCRKLLEKFVPT